jgi:hypothetical protein
LHGDRMERCQLRCSRGTKGRGAGPI